ncbi:alpha/beta hydrolase [Pseudooceanicola sp. CBS1P-1]|uniref:Alpha/beta hydrolase n=2 Tax=Paracoccaceae TaxID=31989 RepID=A0A6L7G658_9RHOB|nr:MULTISPECIES: alpha/beta hydrolase [Pseudooceanicola]MBT9382963.1 alpha/beta hydrolase [Pseudooceanicola endophyticus]MXN19152.1 alpha/beta hydrolase [Pseudooceanicola albus]
MTTLDAYIARTRAPDPGAPLIFAFHGTGGDENQFFDLVRQIHPGAGIVSPRGDVFEGGAARFFRRTGEGVYDMADLARRTAQMAEYVAAHKAAHPGSPVYGFGYSNGANILAAVTMAQPGVFDRIGLLHPLIPWSPQPVDLTGRRVLITAGRHDPICPWPMSAELLRWYADQGAEVTSQVHEGGHEVRPAEIRALADLLAG